MNIHFLSFLVDLVSWLVWGVIYGKFISNFDRVNIKSSNIASAKLAFVSLLGGLIGTLERALPARGFAFYPLFAAIAYSFFFSLIYFVKLRRFTRKRITFLTKMIVNSPLFKKNYSYK